MQKISKFLFPSLLVIVLAGLSIGIAQFNPEIGYSFQKQIVYLITALQSLNRGELIIISLLVIVMICLLMVKIKTVYDETKNIKHAFVQTFFIIAIPALLCILLYVYGNHMMKIQNTENERAVKALREKEYNKTIGNINSWDIEPTPVYPSYSANYANDDILLGSSHNVFIGRVIKQEGNKSRFDTPETQFKVEVISNIKGDLHGTVTVDQFGGYKDGVLYTVADDNPMPNAKNAESYMLQEGNTYFLATRYNEQEDWYTLNSFYTASKLLSKDKDMNSSDLKILADSDDRVKALKSAYPKEKLLDADIEHGNTKNSFASLLPEEQEKLKAEVEKLKSGG